MDADFRGPAKLDLQFVLGEGSAGLTGIELRALEPGSQAVPGVAEEECRSGEPSHDDL